MHFLYINGAIKLNLRISYFGPGYDIKLPAVSSLLSPCSYVHRGIDNNVDDLTAIRQNLVFYNTR